MRRVTAMTQDHPNRVPLCTWQVPEVDGSGSQQIVAYPGEVTTVVGANGSGKSALGVRLDQQTSVVTRRLIAHRKLWFQHAGPDLSPAQREATGRNIESWRRQEDSRYLDHADSQRTGIVIFDLLAKINSQNAQMVGLYQAGATREQVSESVGALLLDRLNAILASAGLHVGLALTDKQTFDAIDGLHGTQYPIYRMSDGEKSALLLAAEVLAAPSDCVQIIDEPERHLHRSISAGLIEAVIADRPDCHFVVLTHDLELASILSGYDGQTFSLASCVWSGSNAVAWDLKPVDPQEQLPESARLAILGGRRDLLFIEGDAHSLDTRLYQLIFPGWTLFPAGGCDQVIRAVTGLRSSQEHHWVRAHGVVDGDGRDEDERESLRARGILTLPVSEVENLYYLGEVLEAVAQKQAELRGESTNELVAAAKTVALEALGAQGTLERIAAGLAMAALRRRLIEHVPKVFDPQADPVEVAIPSPYPAIYASINGLHQSGDYDGLTKVVPIRDTAVRGRIAAALGFRNTDDYESAARVRIREDAELASMLRGLIGPLAVGSAPEARSSSLEIAT
jgi:hypothetical protein